MIIEIHDLVKTYAAGEIMVTALKDIDLSVDKSEYVAVMGASGSGKSTLLNIIGCLDSVTSGKYLLDGIDVTSLSDRQLSAIRNKKIGFIFQAFNLLPKSNALDNVMLPMIYARIPSDQAERIAKDSLIKVGLKDRMYHKPCELSGGQKQKVAIARALVNHPSIILADEPTGNLDSKSGEEIMDILQSLNDEGASVIMVTHDINIASHTKRKIVLKDGSIMSDILKD